MKVFGDNVRKYRQQLAISQEEFAHLAGLHRTYISAIECHKRSISLENIEKVANALGVKAYKLFIEPEDMP